MPGATRLGDGVWLWNHVVRYSSGNFFPLGVMCRTVADAYTYTYTPKHTTAITVELARSAPSIQYWLDLTRGDSFIMRLWILTEKIIPYRPLEDFLQIKLLEPNFWEALVHDRFFIHYIRRGTNLELVKWVLEHYSLEVVLWDEKFGLGNLSLQIPSDPELLTLFGSQVYEKFNGRLMRFFTYLALQHPVHVIASLWERLKLDDTVVGRKTLLWLWTASPGFTVEFYQWVEMKLNRDSGDGANADGSCFDGFTFDIRFPDLVLQFYQPEVHGVQVLQWRLQRAAAHRKLSCEYCLLMKPSSGAGTDEKSTDEENWERGVAGTMVQYLRLACKTADVDLFKFIHAERPDVFAEYLERSKPEPYYNYPTQLSRRVGLCKFVELDEDALMWLENNISQTYAIQTCFFQFLALVRGLPMTRKRCRKLAAYMQRWNIFPVIACTKYYPVQALYLWGYLGWKTPSTSLVRLALRARTLASAYSILNMLDSREFDEEVLDYAIQYGDTVMFARVMRHVRPTIQHIEIALRRGSKLSTIMQMVQVVVGDEWDDCYTIIAFLAVQMGQFEVIEWMERKFPTILTAEFYRKCLIDTAEGGSNAFSRSWWAFRHVFDAAARRAHYFTDEDLDAARKGLNLYRPGLRIPWYSIRGEVLKLLKKNAGTEPVQGSDGAEQS